jgi:LmbE family N-acetylglucosaminyl deacetylase
MIDEGKLIPYTTTVLPVAQGPWLVFAPHADDESFGMGGTILKATEAGIEVHLAVMTDGALGGQQFDLVQTRQQEARNAAAVLGIREVHFLAQPDRGLQVSAALSARLAQLLTALRPAAVFFPGVMELHPDHRACALLVWDALRSANPSAITAVSYEISVQSPVNCLVDITAVMEGKRQAMAVYLSQLGQNNYVDIVQALNRLRTLTLGPEVLWAEGFYLYSAAERTGSLSDWLSEKTRLLLAD